MDYLILLAFIVYFAAVLFIGFMFYKRSHSMEEYILGGRQMNPYVTALSAQASDMSSWLLMGLPGAVMLMGLGEAWIGIGLAAGSYISWLIVAKKLRKHSVVSGNALTMPEFFSNRFRDEKGYLRLIASVVILFFFVIYVASGFKGCGIVMQTVFPELSLSIAMGVGAVIIIVYTFLGGYKAVCWTDFLQGMLMVVAVVVVPLAVIMNLGGWENVSNAWDQVGVEEFTNLFWDGGSPLSAIAIISLLAWAFGYFGMPHIVVRYMSIRSPKEVKVARRISLVWIVIALSAAILIGMVGRAYFQINDLPLDGYNSENIFIDLVSDVFVGSLWPFVAGLLFAAVMAAIMSTADSQLLVASSSITNDVLGKSKRFNFSDAKLMWISRLVVVAVAVIAFVLAMVGSDNIMGLVSYAWAGFGAAFGPLMLLSLYWKRMNLQGAIASMITGFAVIILWESFMDFTGIYSLLPGFLLSLIVGIVVALLTAPPSEEIVEEFDAAQTYDE